MSTRSNKKNGSKVSNELLGLEKNSGHFDSTPTSLLITSSSNSQKKQQPQKKQLIVMANDDSMSVDKKHNEEEKDENDEDYEDDDDDDYEDEEDDDEDYEDEDDDEEDQSNQTPFMSALHASIKQAPPLFTRPEPSALLSRVANFLPQLQAANTKLDSDIKIHGKEAFNIENVDDEEEEQHIEMDLTLGIVEERKEFTQDTLIINPDELKELKSKPIIEEI